MKNSLKAALLSGFIFPGLGHLALKQYKIGIVLIITSTVAVVVIVAGAVRTALAILDEIGAEGVPINMDSIIAVANEATTNSGNFVLNTGLIFLGLCWIFGVVDAYRTGRNIDAQK